MLRPSQSSSGRSSPIPVDATANILLNQPLSESPASTNHATPALRPQVLSRPDGDDIPGLQLDDIQSTVPLDESPKGKESATIAFPQDSGSPKVTITMSNDNLLSIPATMINTPPLNIGDIAIPSLVPFPHTTPPDPSSSTGSSALTEGDKLTDLPATFSAPRLQSLARKVAEAGGIPSQDSISSSMKGQSGLSLRSLESEQSSMTGTVPGKARGDGTPKRVSFDGERPSFIASVRNVFLPASPSLDGRGNEGPRSRSPKHQRSHSSNRSPSPLRNFLWPLHRSHSREEPFVPIDPYKLVIFPPPNTIRHIISQIIRQIYRHLLLRLPSTYFTRVSRVFESAEVTRPEVQRMIEGRNKGDPYRWPADYEWVAPNVSPALIRFKESWESFVESVLKEWKTLNVVSALLLTCVLLLPIYARTKPEIEGASTAPVIRTTAFLSLVCALMSLVYGCVYILRFGTMKGMYRASKWAEEAQQSSSIFWNVWVLLAMPAVWISWSMIFFCICILDFVWDQPFSSNSSSSSLHNVIQPGNVTEALALSLSADDRLALPPRIIISCVFLLGVVYFMLVLRTFRSWSDPRVPLNIKHSMETGRWASRTPSPAPGSPRVGREPRFTAPEAHEMEQEEKLAMKQMQPEGRRTHSMDSVMV